jgi:hypothetical protein
MTFHVKPQKLTLSEPQPHFCTPRVKTVPNSDSAHYAKNVPELGSILPFFVIIQLL